MSTGRRSPKICTNHCRFCRMEGNQIFCRVATAGKDMKYTNYYNGEVPTHVLLFFESVGCGAYLYEGNDGVMAPADIELVGVLEKIKRTFDSMGFLCVDHDKPVLYIEDAKHAIDCGITDIRARAASCKRSIPREPTADSLCDRCSRPWYLRDGLSIALCESYCKCLAVTLIAMSVFRNYLRGPLFSKVPSETDRWKVEALEKLGNLRDAMENHHKNGNGLTANGVIALEALLNHTIKVVRSIQNPSEAVATERERLLGEFKWMKPICFGNHEAICDTRCAWAVRERCIESQRSQP